MGNQLTGKFVHITGSLPRESEEQDITLARLLVQGLAREILGKEGGLVVLINSGQANSTVPFDWDILEAAAKFESIYRTNRILLQTVRHPRWRDVLSDGQREILNTLSENTRENPAPRWVGGRIRETQAELTDAAITIGGGIGVEDTAAMLQEMKKPVLPLNFHIAAQPDDSGTPKLHAESIRSPKSFMRKSHRELVSKVDSLEVFDEESAQRVSRRIIELMCVELKGSAGRKILNAAKPITVFIGRSAAAGITREIISRIF